MTYRKSSFSGNSGCVEVDLGDRVKLRDTKDLTKSEHEYSREDWRLFLEAARHGVYDLPESAA